MNVEIDRCFGAADQDDAVEAAALELGCDVAAGVGPGQRPRLGRSEGEHQAIGQGEVRPGHGPHEQAQGALRRQRLDRHGMAAQDSSTQAAPTDEGPKHAVRHGGVIDRSTGQLDDGKTTTAALHMALLIDAAAECLKGPASGPQRRRLMQSVRPTALPLHMARACSREPGHHEEGWSREGFMQRGRPGRTGPVSEKALGGRRVLKRFQLTLLCSTSQL